MLNINWGFLGLVGIVMLLSLFGIIVLIILGFIIWNYLRHNIKVVILEKIGNSFNIKYDRGRKYFDKKKNIVIFHLYKERIYFNPPLAKYFGYHNNNKKTVMLYKFEEGKFSTLFIDEANLSLTADNLAFDKWHTLKVKESYEQYKQAGFWEKYGALIGFGITLVICFVMVIITTNNISKVAGSIYALADKLPNKAQMIEGATETAKGIIFLPFLRRRK